MIKQQTLREEVVVSGIGLHSGKNVRVILKPASEDFGIQFKRTDITDSPLIKADCSNVYKSNRHTVLGNEKINVATVEHLLSAFYALGVDNALVELDGEELPIMDGSASAFVDAIKISGIVELNKDKEFLELQHTIVVREGDSEITIVPSDDFELTVMVDFDSKITSPQFAILKNLQDYQSEIANSRTFVFLHELEALSNAGLVKGGSLENAMVFVEDIPSKEQQDLLNQRFNHQIIVNNTGLLENQTLRFSNEAARHKLLDLLGDISLLGIPVKGKIFARRPGHKINVKFTEKLKNALSEQRKSREIPVYDPNKAPVYDINHICTKLHHRFPFLLIDKIIDLSDKHVVSVKNVTMNEPFFPGHFPGNPIMPGVLQVEAMAQTGGILVMENIDEPHAYDTYFLKIDGARFRKPVIPGDTLLFRLDLTSPIRRGLVEMKGRAYVGNTLVAEADLLAQIIKRR